VLAAAVELEQRAVAVYKALAGDPAIGPVALVIARQEREHADGLIAALRDLGGTPPPNPGGPEDVPGLAAALRRGAAADFALELEAAALAAYRRALGELTTPELLSTVAAIMASEAQHELALRLAAEREPAPAAFVTGLQ
jgi:rubrerythrin